MDVYNLVVTGNKLNLQKLSKYKFSVIVLIDLNMFGMSMKNNIQCQRDS